MIPAVVLSSIALLGQTVQTPGQKPSDLDSKTAESANHVGVNEAVQRAAESARASFDAESSKEVPGAKLVDVGGRKMEILTGGHGNLTVVFESGLGAGLTSWSDFAPKISEYARWVCYSRAGYRKSESVEGLRTPREIAQELHSLLVFGGFKPPFVLVGHSLGGLYVREFAALYPGDVAGLVLEDPAYEREQIDLKTIAPESFAMLTAVPPWAPGRIKNELAGVAQVYDTGALDVDGKLPNIPVAVLMSMKLPSGAPPALMPIFEKLLLAKRAADESLLHESTFCMQIVSSRSGHVIHVDEPDLTLDSIRWVVRAADEVQLKGNSKL